MGAQDERGLEQDLVHGAGAPAVEVELIAGLAGPLGVLVAQAEAEKLGRPEGDVGSEGPLPSGLHGELRVVVASAERPTAPRLDLTVEVPAEPVERAPIRHRGIGDTVAVRVDLLIDVRLPRGVNTF